MRNPNDFAKNIHNITEITVTNSDIKVLDSLLNLPNSEILEQFGTYNAEQLSRQNTERLQAYLKLIDTLLSSASGQELEVLQANQELIDAGLILTMQQVAAIVAERGDENIANWLQSVAAQLADMIVNLSSVEDLELVIAAFTNALKLDTLTVNPYQWARTQKILGNAYIKRIQGDRAANIEKAIACCRAALQIYTREAFPQDWASTQYNLGIAYGDRINGEKAENIELAIRAYTDALSIYTREAFPQDWASTQSNLGIAYRNRINGEKAENIELAIAAYTDALSIYTRVAFPQDWASTQSNLGIAYGDRINGEKAENIELAITAYTDALSIRTREAFPQDWASTQNNLGIAYRDRINGEKAENIELAITAFTDALSIRTREAFPQDWASTQSNLGNAYIDRINGEKAENLEAAIRCYQDALLIYTPEQFPDKCVIIQEKLSNAQYLLEHYQRELELASLFKPNTPDKALARIELTRANLLDLEVDAIVVPTNTSLGLGGEISRQIFERLQELDLEWYERLRTHSVSLGEVMIVDASSLPSHYLFYTPIDYNADATVTTVSQAITAALNKAESLDDVRTIAFPSIGTGLAGLNPTVLAPNILRIVASHLEQGSHLEKVIFAFVRETAYQAYANAYQILLLETRIVYHVLITTSQETVTVGEEVEISVNLHQAKINQGEIYTFEISHNDSIGSELNIILNAPGFQLNGDNTASLPLDPDIAQDNQIARFHLTALRPGNATISAELYRGDTFETQLETKIQVADINEADFSSGRITTQPRPLPQPDFILRVQNVGNETNSTCRFQYQLRSFRFALPFTVNNIYHSESLSNSWIQEMQGLLANTLDNISDSLFEEGRSRLASLGEYLFQHLFPTELQSDFRTLIADNRTFTLLILTDHYTWIPWEILHVDQKFLSDRFIIGRWLWELNDIISYEFPVGSVNVSYYANVEQPELWATLLSAPGAPPPELLLEGMLHNLDSTEAMRGLHIIRYSQSPDAAMRGNAPITLNDTNDTQDIEQQMRPAKLNLHRHRPFVTLSYVKTDAPEVTTLEQTWATAFIRAGCSGFTGSLWAVDPDVEAAFISYFYNRLWTGASLGEAFDTSRQLARAVAPDSLDWLAYVLFGDPMARPYLPVEGKGYAVVEPIGREIDDPLPPGVTIRFRLSLRRTPPVWHEERVIEIAENLSFENLQVHVKTFGLKVTPDSPIVMSLAPTGNYLGWFTLVAPPEMAGNSALVQVYFMDGVLPIHSLMFSLNISNEGGE